ncbi:MAG TPA: hypothetical protein P5210_07980, partial [Draconibacterium sp.]|nr:hypothetical protein [Draconibacterium sp.]
TGQNIYVKFENTSGIENGDTLFINKNEVLVPALVVQHHSTISCLCNPVGENSFKIGDLTVAKIKTKQKKELAEIQTENQTEKDVSEQVITSASEKKSLSTTKQDVVGTLSISSYSNFSNTESDNLHRFRYTFSMDARNISNSKLSAETYVSFSHKLNQWDLVQEDLNNALKIYSLNLIYDFNNTTTMWVGRKINPKIANIGAVDGIQFQKDWNRFFVGLVGGTRPDFQNYGFNSKLLEYGVYIGQNQKVENGFVQSSLAFFEQRNSGNTDRRFIYFQHSNSFIKNVNIFSSFELDLYKIENGQPQNTVSLTSLYLSLNYRVSRRLSIFGSYDNRKNVIYYETFKSYTDAILQQASRQGLRFRINYRPINLLNIGVNAGTRFMKNDTRKTNTLNGYVTYSKVPMINSSLSLSTNLMQTSYLNGQVYGARLSKDILKGKIYGSLNYRWVKFDYASSVSQLKQNIGEIDFSYQFSKKLYLSFNYEATFQKTEHFNRLYLNLRIKF